MSDSNASAGNPFLDDDDPFDGFDDLVEDPRKVAKTEPSKSSPSSSKSGTRASSTIPAIPHAARNTEASRPSGGAPNESLKKASDSISHGRETSVPEASNEPKGDSGDDLTFEGFREKLPERVELPKDIAANNDVSNAYRENAKAQKASKNAKKPKRERAKPKRVSRVDEELEEAAPVIERLHERDEDVTEGAPENANAAADSSSGNSANSSSGHSPNEADESLTPGEKWTGRTKQRRYRYVSDSGLLNGAELEFFKRNETTRRAFLEGDTSLDYLRPGFGFNETDEDRAKRVERATKAVFGRDAYKRGNKKRWSRERQEVIEFLAKFKYATPRQLAKLFSETPANALKRLKELRSYGLVVDKPIISNEPIWFLTDAGMLLSGYDLPKVTEARITFPMFPHQFAVNHLAANLWGAGVNVLNEEDYPKQNRVDLLGREQLGDTVVSEQEIQSSFGKLKLFSKADVYLPTLKATIEREFREWEAAGGVDFGPSPETMPGNEYMWAIFPPAIAKSAYHVPDLVVSRPRAEDGSPESVAVELEIQNKSLESYIKALTAYRYSERTYKQVVWVCSKASSARKIREAAESLNMYKSGRVRVVPVITQDGVFTKGDLWTL